MAGTTYRPALIFQFMDGGRYFALQNGSYLFIQLLRSTSVRGMFLTDFWGAKKGTEAACFQSESEERHCQSEEERKTPSVTISRCYIARVAGPEEKEKGDCNNYLDGRSCEI